MKKRNIILLALCFNLASCSMLENISAITDVTNEESSTIESKSEQPKLKLCSNSTDLELSSNGNEYYSTLESEIKTSSLNDVTSSDGVTFYKAEYDATGMNITFKETNGVGNDYVEVNLFFKTSLPGEIYLCNDSAFMAYDLSSNKSSFGDFSRDYIVGATRLSMQVTGYQNSTSSVYNKSSDNIEACGKIIEPDNEVKDDKGTLLYKVNKINLTQNNATGAWSVNPNDTNKENEKVYALEDASKGTFSKTLVETEGFVDEQKIIEISSTSEIHPYTKDNYQISKVTLRIWIEGQDNEDVTPLSKGRFGANLNFEFKKYE